MKQTMETSRGGMVKTANKNVESLPFEEWKKYIERAEFLVDRGYVIGYNVKDLAEILYRKDCNENR